MATSAHGFEQYWTINDVADRLHVTRDCVKKWLSKEKLRKTKAGSKTLVSESDLQDFLTRSTEKAAASPAQQAA